MYFDVRDTFVNLLKKNTKFACPAKRIHTRYMVGQLFSVYLRMLIWLVLLIANVVRTKSARASISLEK